MPGLLFFRPTHHLQNILLTNYPTDGVVVSEHSPERGLPQRPTYGHESHKVGQEGESHGKDEMPHASIHTRTGVLTQPHARDHLLWPDGGR